MKKFHVSGLNLKPHARALAVLMASAVCCATAHAQVLNDPMRPPAGMVDGDTAQNAAPDTPFVLQSVKISGSERIAIVSGKTVRQGDKLGSATVVRIGDGEIVVKEGNTEQVLKLFPEIDKRATDKRPGVPDTRGTRTPSRRPGIASGGGTP